MWCFTRFVTICTILKTWKTPMEECYLSLLQAQACNFTKNNTPLWVFFTFFKLYKWYQNAQSIAYVQINLILISAALMLGFNLTIILLSECEYGKSISFTKYLSVSIQIMFTGKKKRVSFRRKLLCYIIVKCSTCET